MTPYRSSEHAVAAALEEQRELVWLEKNARSRRRRAAIAVALLLSALFAVVVLAASAPPAKRYACRQAEVRYEPYGEGSSRIARPPDTWTECHWE